jgi:hypothetical protein
MGKKLSEDHIVLAERFPTGKSLNEDHLIPSKVKRYRRGQTYLERAQSALFNNTDDVIDEVYCDIANGVSRSDITQKLMKGLYKSQRREMKYGTAQQYYNTALDRMHFNTDIEHQRLKDVFFSRYESLLETAIKKGDVYNAKGVLDSMAKIFLADDIKNKSNAQIEVNAGDNKVTIKFGFDQEDKEDDDEAQEAEIVEE